MSDCSICIKEYTGKICEKHFKSLGLERCSSCLRKYSDKVVKVSLTNDSGDKKSECCSDCVFDLLID